MLIARRQSTWQAIIPIACAGWRKHGSPRPKKCDSKAIFLPAAHGRSAAGPEWRVEWERESGVSAGPGSTRTSGCGPNRSGRSPRRSSCREILQRRQDNDRRPVCRRLRGPSLQFRRNSPWRAAGKREPCGPMQLPHKLLNIPLSSLRQAMIRGALSGALDPT